MFIALATTWGASFLFIKIGLEGLTPEQVVWGRLVLGALALLVLAAVTRTPLPRDARLWGHLLVVALLLCVLPFSLFAWAEQHVSSGVASILNATTPLMTMAVALAALPQERLTRSRVAGLLLGFAGVMVVLGAWDLTGGGALAGELACLGATASYGVAFVYLRRFVAGRGVPALASATVQVLLGAGVMLLATPVLARPAPVLTGRVVSAVALLGVAGTGLAYVWNTAIVNRWGATNASTVTYLTPLVGVVLGVVVLGEHASWNLPVGALVVIAGVVVAQDRLGRLRRHATARRGRRPRLAGTGDSAATAGR
jgi:drug/metabolite transporter (DMT)-like permease